VDAVPDARKNVVSYNYTSPPSRSSSLFPLTASQL